MNAPVVDMSLVVTEKTFILLDVMASSFKGSLIENLLDRRCSFIKIPFCQDLRLIPMMQFPNITRVKFYQPTGQALQAEKGVPDPCPWINQGESEGFNFGLCTYNFNS